ncbi:hypothetical protein AABB24_007125, partial [Solanum stoloniferum]
NLLLPHTFLFPKNGPSPIKLPSISLLCHRFRLQTTGKWQFPVVINISPHAVHQSWPLPINFKSPPSPFFDTAVNNPTLFPCYMEKKTQELKEILGLKSEEPKKG